MIELTTRNLVDLGLSRTRAVIATATGGFALGLPSALHLGFLVNQDNVWGVALLLSGAFVAAVVVAYGARRIREEIATRGDWQLPTIWILLMRFLIPTTGCCFYSSGGFLLL